MKTGGSERKTALGGYEEDGTVNSMLFFDSQGQKRSGLISCKEKTGGLTLTCRPEALNNPNHNLSLFIFFPIPHFPFYYIDR